MASENSGFSDTTLSSGISVPKFDSAESYAKRRSEFLQKLEKQQKENNTYYLQRMLNGLNLSCTNFWNTKSALNGVESLEYHLNCNLNCDSSVQSKIASLKAQQPILEEKLAEFKKGNSDGYQIQIENQQKNPVWYS